VSEQSRIVVGVDGGGTKTHVIVVAGDGSVLSEITGGPSSLTKVGTVQAAKTIVDLIQEVCERTECSADRIQTVVAGLAGAGRGDARASFLDEVNRYATKRKFALRSVTVETDAYVALEAAFAGGPGIVVIAGTGSIALYRTEANLILRAGGWGNVIGDEGGGYAIARDALTAVVRQHDGRGEKTILTQKALASFNAPTVEDLIARIHDNHIDLSAFAPRVIEAIAERDRTAYTILTSNANALAELVRVLTMKARPSRKLPVALMGGLLESDNAYAKLVREKILGTLPHVVVQKPKFPAAFGAAIIGLNAFR
jgi:glucosamine kinase